MDKKKYIIISIAVILIIVCLIIILPKNKKIKDYSKEIVGEYTLLKIEKDGEVQSYKELGKDSLIGEIIISSNNTYIETLFEKSNQGTYSINGNVIEFKSYSNDIQTGVYQDGRIELSDKNYEEGYKFIFGVKQEDETIINKSFKDYFKNNYGSDVEDIKINNLKILTDEEKQNHSIELNNIAFEVEYNLTIAKGVDTRKYSISNGEVEGNVVKNKKSCGIIKKDVNGEYIIISLSKSFK